LLEEEKMKKTFVGMAFGRLLAAGLALVTAGGGLPGPLC